MCTLGVTEMLTTSALSHNYVNSFGRCERLPPNHTEVFLYGTDGGSRHTEASSTAGLLHIEAPHMFLGLPQTGPK